MLFLKFKSCSLFPRLQPFLFSKPQRVDLELTNACNLSCKMCIRNKRNIGMMNFVLFKKAVDEVAEIGNIDLVLYGAGEPLMHSNFAQILEYAMAKRDKLHSVGFFTNGTLFDEKIAETVVKLGLDWVTFSFDGVDEVNDRIRLGSNYTAIKENINRLLKIRNSRKTPKVGINTTVTNMQSDDDLVKIKEEWIDKVDHIDFVPQLDRDFRILTLDRTKQFNPKYKVPKPCLMPFIMLCILWNGNVTFCDLDYFEGKNLVGNLKKDSLMDIWRSKEIREVQKGLLFNNPDPESLCKQCKKYHWKIPKK